MNREEDYKQPANDGGDGRDIPNTSPFSDQKFVTPMTKDKSPTKDESAVCAEFCVDEETQMLIETKNDIVRMDDHKYKQKDRLMGDKMMILAK